MSKTNLKELKKKRVFPGIKKEKKDFGKLSPERPKELLEDKSWVSQIVWNLRERYLKVKK